MSDTDQQHASFGGSQLSSRKKNSCVVTNFGKCQLNSAKCVTFEAMNLDACSIGTACFDSFSGTDLRTGHKQTDLQPVRAAECSAVAHKHLCQVEICNPVTRISFYQ